MTADGIGPSEIRTGPLRWGRTASSPAETVRVCHVIHSLRQGGAEHVLLTLAEVAPQVGVELSVLSLMPDDGLLYARRLRELGVPVRCLALPTRWDVRGLSRGREVIAALRPDVVHTHLKHADLVGAFAARRLGLPMVSTLHVIEDAPRLRQRAKRRLAAQARLRTADVTVTVSDAQRAWYLSAFPAEPSRVVTVRNGVLPPAEVSEVVRARTRRDLGVPDGATLVAIVAIMRPGKGHAELLDAVAQLPTDAGLHLVVAGDGPLRPEIEARVRGDAALRDRVTFAGFVEDVTGLLAATDLVVQPSHVDALPTALIYALAAGVPAVASDVGGIPEIVGPDAGVLVPPRDVPALREAIAALGADPDRRARLGAAARARFEEHFHAVVWARRLREVYTSVRSGAAR